MVNAGQCVFQFHDYEDQQCGPVQVLPCGDTVFPQDPTTGLNLTEMHDFINECNSTMPITHERAKELEAKTVRQAENELWHQARHNRITSSNFHRVVKRQKDINEKFVQSVLSSPKFSSIPTSYGTAHEPVAKEEYCNKRPQAHILDCGFVVNPAFSFLGASPDAKICSGGVTGVLEIKCPYSARDKKIQEAVSEVNGFCLTECDGTVQLKKDHAYMYQVQGQLMVTGAPFCEFVVYTKTDIHIERILPDTTFQENMLQKLSSFYKMHAVPYMQKEPDST